MKYAIKIFALAILATTLIGCRHSNGWRCHGKNPPATKPVFVAPPPPARFKACPCSRFPRVRFRPCRHRRNRNR